MSVRGADAKQCSKRYCSKSEGARVAPESTAVGRWRVNCQWGGNESNLIVSAALPQGGKLSLDALLPGLPSLPRLRRDKLPKVSKFPRVLALGSGNGLRGKREK